VGLATHYHTSAVHPLWADKLAFIGTIGAHRFYRWAGSAGQPAAFTGDYRGGEPLAAPHPRTWVPAAADLADPLTLEKAFEEGRMAALDRRASLAPATGQAESPLRAGLPRACCAHGSALRPARQRATAPGSARSLRKRRQVDRPAGTAGYRAIALAAD
jgi:hypothetical protein